MLFSCKDIFKWENINIILSLITNLFIIKPTLHLSVSSFNDARHNQSA